MRSISNTLIEKQKQCPLVIAVQGDKFPILLVTEIYQEGMMANLLTKKSSGWFEIPPTASVFFIPFTTAFHLIDDPQIIEQKG